MLVAGVGSATADVHVIRANAGLVGIATLLAGQGATTIR
jgi:hypothetical protein